MIIAANHVAATIKKDIQSLLHLPKFCVNTTNVKIPRDWPQVNHVVTLFEKENGRSFLLRVVRT